MNNPAISNDVYHWPEFQAFMKRLGFPWEKYTVDIVLVMKMDELVHLYHHYQGENNPPVPNVDVQADFAFSAQKQEQVDKPNYIDTTTQHNKEWRTKQPKPSWPMASLNSRKEEPQ